MRPHVIHDACIHIADFDFTVANIRPRIGPSEIDVLDAATAFKFPIAERREIFDEAGEVHFKVHAERAINSASILLQGTRLFSIKREWLFTERWNSKIESTVESAMHVAWGLVAMIAH